MVSAVICMKIQFWTLIFLHKIQFFSIAAEAPPLSLVLYLTILIFKHLCGLGDALLAVSFGARSSCI